MLGLSVPTFLANGIVAYSNAMSVVNQPIEDTVGQRRILASRGESGGGLATTLVSVITLRGSASVDVGNDHSDSSKDPERAWCESIRTRTQEPIL
jgi:hypothetical protein